MGKYIQKHKNSGYHVHGAELADEDAERQQAKPQEPQAHDYTDDILADIDEALTGMDAQEFVKSYIQKGGQ